MSEAQDMREFLLRNGYAETREYHETSKKLEAVFYLFLNGEALYGPMDMEQAYEQLMELLEE